jgi:thiamine biosynthesis lipoprotein
MGTVAHVIVVGDPNLAFFARARVDDLEQRWSRFIATSEVSRLNRARGTSTKVSADTFRLIQESVDAWRRTQGRFDPTVLGDMLRAGYDRTYVSVAIRAQRGISLLRANCGGIVLDEASQSVALPVDTGFDPGGLGKGLAADIVVEELLRRGAAGACVNLGGDVRVEGDGPHDEHWTVAVVDPATDERISVVGLRAGGVATSTTAKRTWTITGEYERVHHVMDPAKGASVAGRNVVSASALARTAANAEAAATSALIAPVGHELGALTELGCDGILTTTSGDHISTPAFAAFTVDVDIDAGAR